MGIFQNIFGAPSAPQQAQQPNQPQPGNIPPNAAITMQGQQNANTAPNGTVPALNPAELNKTAEPQQQAPLSEFKDLWKNEPKLDAAGKPIVEDSSYFGQLNSDALLKAAQTIDFTKDLVTPEILQAIQAGGEQGTAALLTVVNKSNQLAYAKSAEVAATLFEKGMKDAEARFAAKLPSHVRSANISDKISQNPMFNNPAARPIIDMVTAQIQAKYPNASVAELDDMVGKYFIDFKNTLGSASGPANQQSNTGRSSSLQHEEQDFSFMLDQPNPFAGN